jgi:asparagine synthase (glutamine-hydrolysing)
MSGLLALFTHCSDVRSRALLPALHAMPDRGSQVEVVLDSRVAALAVVTHAWQEHLCGGSVGSSANVVVVADASLYYRDELERKLRSLACRPRSLSAADLIAAAVDVWGDEAPRHLEGDFAFVAVNQETGRVVAARDPVGMRPLYFGAIAGAGLALASSPMALVEPGLVSPDLNLPWLAELMSGVVAVPRETAFRRVSQLSGGECLTMNQDEPYPLMHRYWTCPTFSEAGNSPLKFDEAAEVLRDLLSSAVRERLEGVESAAVTLSGGRDSTAVYACARSVAGNRARAVSWSYPEGDIGREDEIILDVLRCCGGDPTWVQTVDVPLLLDVVDRSANRPDAFVHGYEGLNHAINATAAGLGARVLLNGIGGDALFRSDFAYLSDLLFQGHLVKFWNEWRSEAAWAGWRDLFIFAVLPRIGQRGRSAIGLVRHGRRLHDLSDPPVSPWLLPKWKQMMQSGQRRKQWDMANRRGSFGADDHERRWLIQGAFSNRILAEFCRLALLHGVEQRTPFYDLRLINFAASRPRTDRRGGGDSKLLLRAAMTGMLPPSVTAPRPFKSGVTRDYLYRRLDVEAPNLLALGSRLQVAEVGLLDEENFRSFLEHIQDGFGRSHTIPFLFTLFTEFWLRSATRTAEPGAPLPG